LVQVWYRSFLQPDAIPDIRKSPGTLGAFFAPFRFRSAFASRASGRIRDQAPAGPYKFNARCIGAVNSL